MKQWLILVLCIVFMVVSGGSCLGEIVKVTQLDDPVMNELFSFAANKGKELGDYIEVIAFDESGQAYYGGDDKFYTYLQEIEFDQPAKTLILWPNEYFKPDAVFDRLKVKNPLPKEVYLPSLSLNMTHELNRYLGDNHTADFCVMTSLFDTVAINSVDGVVYIVLWYAPGYPQVATAFCPTDDGVMITKTSLIYCESIEENEMLFLRGATNIFTYEAFDIMLMEQK